MEMLLDIQKQLHLNWTFFVLFGMISVLYWILTPLLWKPLLKTITTREGLTSGADKEAVEIQESFSATAEKFDQKMRVVYSEAANVVKEAKEAALLEKEKIIQAAEQQCRDQIQAARDEAIRSMSDVRAGLQKESEAIADLIVKKMLGKETIH